MLLYQPAGGYRYNSDSIFLVDFIRRFRPRGRLLDVGAGVGILSLLLARDYPVQVTLSEKQPGYLAYARHNFAIHGLPVEAVGGDFLDAEFEGGFDFIVSNPPFYDPRVSQSADPRLNAARYAQHLPLEAFVARVRELLKPRGWFILCYDARQSDRLFRALAQEKFQAETVRFVHPKADREAKIVMVAARRHSRSLCAVLPPLIVFDAQSRYLPEAAEAFRRAGTHSVTGERGYCEEEKNEERPK
ncbi:methyltransferase [Nitratifractor sp.]|uniref:tRNA1(Val) (adenine(37)-N6)-methyltransferase n=1 Tax=Nitratifractor sp. TaxID=2268144 RepID=UPI0025F0D404|nr:methyltransferase [Nitratifractor sp.]